MRLRLRPLAASTTGRSRDLIPERAANTAILARRRRSLLATLVGLPLGIVTGSRRGGVAAGAIRAVSVVLLSMPPLLTSLFLVFVAARTGWLPVGGMRSADARRRTARSLDLLRHLVVPGAGAGAAARGDVRAAAGAGDARGRSAQPFVLAALARGVPRSRIVWRDALKAALRPVAVGLRAGRRHAAQRIVRRRSRSPRGRASAA